MRTIKACGILCFRRNPNNHDLYFLLMRHSWRWDLPKGHIDGDEDERTCALRELHEETGIPPHAITLDEGFRYETSREVSPPYLKGETVNKAYVFFAGKIEADVPIQTSDEHIGHVWHRWQPPHTISDFLIDEVLQAYADYASKSSSS